MLFSRKLALSLLAGTLASTSSLLAEDGPVTLEKNIKPLLQQFCFDCHNAEKMKGDVNLVDLAKSANLEENREEWEKVISSVESGDMPPEKKPQLAAKEKDLVLHFLDGQLSKIDCSVEKNPGRVTLRRLNREEYRNTIRDLLRVDFDPSEFPNDEVGYGFDNIADVLSLSPMLMEKYMDAAEQVAAKAIITGPLKPQVRKYRGKEFNIESTAGGPTPDGLLTLASAGTAARKVEFPAPGDYVLHIKAAGDQAGAEPTKLAVRLEEKSLGEIEVKAPVKKPGIYDVKVRVEKAGWQNLALTFTNDYYDITNPDVKLRGDRNVYLDSVDVEYPLSLSGYPESHRFLIGIQPAAGEEKAVARRLLPPLLSRAYRRPVMPAEVEKVAKFVDLAMDNKGTFLEGMQVALQAVLSSPQFLFRWESEEKGVQPGQVRRLTDYEIASRLSYFLWSSMPDQELFQMADQGKLLKDGNLEEQITRMLKDSRSRALVTNFAGQWLQIRNIYEIAPDPEVFPKWDDNLRYLMKTETEKFVEAIIKEDRNVSELLDADFTFLNDKLARFYGIEGVYGGDFKRVQLPPDSPRGGVLTQASVLMTTSTPTRTSPVIRGKWILEQILGTPPPLAPANVPPLTEQKTVNQTASLRERFTEHSKSVECAGCHKRMDPLGFALENFDAIGTWREKDGKFPIDPSGKLTTGEKFKNPRELKAILKSNPQFINSFTEKLMIYALGRGLNADDRCAIKGVVEKAQAQNSRFSALVVGIVTSDPFMKRKTSEVFTRN